MHSRPTILITGATDGIGLALAQRYHAQGAACLLLGRRDRSGLDLDLFGPLTYCRVDLAQPYCAAIVAAFLNNVGITHLDMLIHNAGVGFFGSVTAQTARQIRDMVAVNLRAPIALTHELLPRLVGGKVVFISSVVSALPGPDYAVYAATKAALDGFATNLCIELRGQTAVQLIHPGATRTNMHLKSGAGHLNWQQFPAVEQVAEKIVRAIASNRPAVTIGAGNRVLQLVGRHGGGLTDAVQRRRQQRGSLS